MGTFRQRIVESINNETLQIALDNNTERRLSGVSDPAWVGLGDALWWVDVERRVQGTQATKTAP